MEIPARFPSAPVGLESAKAAREVSKDEAPHRPQAPAAKRTEDGGVNPAPPTQDLARDELEQVVEALNAQSPLIHRNLQFSVDDSTGRTVITLRDSQSGDVIRQIPSDAVLRLAERLASGEDLARASGTTAEASASSPYRLHGRAAGLGIGALLDTEL